MLNLQTHNIAQQSCATYGRFQREPAEQLRSAAADKAPQAASASKSL